MLMKHLVPQVKDLNRRFEEEGMGEVIFQQDGASAHTAFITRDFFGRHKILLLSNWPPNSTNLNLIELVWALIKQRLRRDPAKTIEDLKVKVAHHFHSILFDGELTRKLYASYRRRLELVIQYDGARIPDERRKKSTVKKSISHPELVISQTSRVRVNCEAQ